MSNSKEKNKLKYYSGWKLTPYKIKYILSLGKYLFQKKKYSLFRFKNLYQYRKRKILDIPKFVKFNRQYYAPILRVPRWPSKPYDHMVAGGGLNLAASGTSLKTQIDSVILGITRKCNYRCQHCYEYFNLAKEDSVPIERWKEIVKDIQNLGVSIIVFSGGEPMLRFDGLLELLECGDKRISDFHVHTSGNGVTSDKALALKSAGLTAAAVALDDYIPNRQDEFRGFDGAYKEATQAIQYFREAGVFPYINMFLRKNLIRSEELWSYFQHIKRLNVGIVSLIEPKPCGRYFSIDGSVLLSEEDRKTITDFFTEANHSRNFKNYPYVAYINYYEKPELFGCLMGGLSHFYINSMGNVQPCIFLPVTFGNIMEEKFSAIYKRMREAIPKPVHKSCPSLLLSKEIKEKRDHGISLPVPYEELEKEWHSTLD